MSLKVLLVRYEKRYYPGSFIIQLSNKITNTKHKLSTVFDTCTAQKIMDLWKKFCDFDVEINKYCTNFLVLQKKCLDIIIPSNNFSPKVCYLQIDDYNHVAPFYGLVSDDNYFLSFYSEEESVQTLSNNKKITILDYDPNTNTRDFYEKGLGYIIPNVISVSDFDDYKSDIDSIMILFALKLNKNMNICYNHQCCKTGNKVCIKCKDTTYCSIECKDLDWIRHEKYCS